MKFLKKKFKIFQFLSKKVQKWHKNGVVKDGALNFWFGALTLQIGARQNVTWRPQKNKYWQHCILVKSWLVSNRNNLNLCKQQKRAEHIWRFGSKKNHKRQCWGFKGGADSVSKLILNLLDIHYQYILEGGFPGNDGKLWILHTIQNLPFISWGLQ